MAIVRVIKVVSFWSPLYNVVKERRSKSLAHHDELVFFFLCDFAEPWFNAIGALLGCIIRSYYTGGHINVASEIVMKVLFGLCRLSILWIPLYSLIHIYVPHYRST